MMIMRKTVIYIFSLLIVLSGCSYDKGNYDYRQLDEPKVSVVDQVSILTYTSLKINPKYDENFDYQRYDYEWKAVDNNSLSDPVILGNQSALEYEVALAPGSYSLFFTITEKESGVFWRHTVDLTVNSSTSEGWMVLCSDHGRTRLDFVSVVTGVTYRDILASGGMPQWNGPRKIQWLSEKTDASSPFYLLTDEGAGTMVTGG